MTRLRFREGTGADLQRTFALAERVARHGEAQNAVVPDGRPPTEGEIDAEWSRRRALVEFVAAQPGSYWVCEDGEGLVGFARVVRFEGMEELTELGVDPDRQGLGVGRGLLDRCWPDVPTPELGRMAIVAGAPAALGLHMGFGAMPVAGHWLMRVPTERYVHARTAEREDSTAGGIHVLAVDRAVTEWQRLEPPAIGHGRPRLHEFFARDRACLAQVDAGTGEVTGLCWVSAGGEIGPAVGAWPKDLVPVVLAALDRVAGANEPEFLTLNVASITWWLLHRLHTLGFRVHLPAWIMASEPIPGLDRYLPTQPSLLL